MRILPQNNTVKLAEGIYWVGSTKNTGGLKCNPYLLIDGEEAVLFDPGSVLDFEEVYENVRSLIPIENVKYIVLHHQDPDFCSSVPLFEKAGAEFKIVTQWRTETLIRFYGIVSECYLVDEHNYSLTLASGRELQFVPTPYLHFPGAITTYDPINKILFSSDLFGAYSFETEFYAEENYIEKMNAFHEHYMPSNDILRPVMELFILMDIRMIAPQHGSIINKDPLKYMEALRDLECGVLLDPVKVSLKEAGGWAAVCNIVLKRYSAVFTEAEVRKAVEGMSIETGKHIYEITDYNYIGIELWEDLFETVYRNEGIKWLLAVEPLVEKLSKEYEIPMPRIFGSELRGLQQQSLLLQEEVSELKESNRRLRRNIEQTQGRISTCDATGLYNGVFFKEYLITELDEADIDAERKCLAVITLDDTLRIKYLYGDAEADNIMKGITYLLNEEKKASMILFQIDEFSIACYMPNTSKEEAEAFLEKIRNEIRTSNQFMEKVTVSIGLSTVDESKERGSEESLSKAVYSITAARSRIARTKGGNLIINDSDPDEDILHKGKILIADSDSASRNVIKSSLENLGYKVITAADGEEALDLMEKEMPDLIVSEVILPKIDGFVLCEKMLLHSSTKDVPFIIVSNLKNEDSVKRAVSLGIEHYFQKPYMLSELLGIIQLKFKGAVMHENR